jgi:hypothetical protein
MKRCGLSMLVALIVGMSALSRLCEPFERGVAWAQEDTSALTDKPVSDGTIKVRRTIHASVVAIDQPYVINRLGASQPAGMIFVLKSDLVAKKSPVFDLQLLPSVPDKGGITKAGKTLVVVAAIGKVLHFRIFDGDGNTVKDTNETELPAFAAQIEKLRNQLQGLWPPQVLKQQDKDLVIAAVKSIVSYTPPPKYDNFKLRDGKRPRPLVLRMNVGDLLEIHFENWLQSLTSPATNDGQKTKDLANNKPFIQKTRYAGIHVNGLELVPQKVGDKPGIKSDGSWVGENDSGLLPPRSTKPEPPPADQWITYRLYARETGTFLLTSGADTTVHQLNAGLFGAVNVQPRGAEWYRSQTTQCELQAATLKKTDLRAHEQSIGDYQIPADLDQEQAKQERDEVKAQERGELDAAERVEAIARELDDVTAPRSRDRVSLRTTAPGSRTPVVANVYVDPLTDRIFSEHQQPLINYFAVFGADDLADCPTAVTDKPILSMLEVELVDERAEPMALDAPARIELFKTEIERIEVFKTEIGRLDDAAITLFLRKQFEKKHIDLAADATVARVAYKQMKYSWVVANPGTTAIKPGADVVSGKTYLVLWDGAQKLTIQECRLHLVHSDLTALITGPNAGKFPYYQDAPEFYTNPASPDRRQPYREFTIIYHQSGNAVQAFPQWSNNNLFQMINAGMDEFGINYGIAAIGPEIVANRLGVGPMGNAQQPPGKSGQATAPQANQSNDAVDLKYEEFFLSSWCVGDPAMIVDVPANAPNDMVSNPDEGSKIVGKVEDNPVQFGNFKALSETEPKGKRPTKAFYPDDPSNVYHSYMRDHLKMRVLHAGPGPAHVHHLHAHQWLKSPNSPEATYLDSQLILPGSAYTLEMTYNGSGNRNQTVGDSIFHCHFYAHFAKGMWSLWRVHDTFESGTKLDKDGRAATLITLVEVTKEGKPVVTKGGERVKKEYVVYCEEISPGTIQYYYRDDKGDKQIVDKKNVREAWNRALPDGEIVSGTPTPALVPLPTLGMAPMPAPVHVADLSPWYVGKGKCIGEGEGMGRRIHVVPKNWERILAVFDSDKDRRLDPKECEAWHDAITKAENDNKGKQVGDAGFKWVPYPRYENPGYPFFIPGVSGHRPPHPPLDMAWKEEDEQPKPGAPPKDPQAARVKVKAKWTNKEIETELGIVPASDAVVEAGDVQYLDGGLPRHLVLGGDLVSQYNTRWDFSKDFVKYDKPTKSYIGGLYAFQLPEDGTPIEQAAMRAHGKRAHKTALPENGDLGNFILNGLGPVHGAPYANPSVTDDGNSSGVDRRYQAAVIQTDVVLNKKGWHYPQSRFITLWEDVAPTISNDRPPEPFFIRTATNDATELWHTNLVPNYYELDDFQVRTPTDVIGQHIHLVKFDVTSSDGGANGWNYEDGTFGPAEVRERIEAIKNVGGLYAFDDCTGYVDKTKQKKVAVWKNKYAYPKRGNVGDPENGLFGKPPANQDWEGAMTTIQRWAIDPLLNWQAHDRTLRTVFTHDHLGPSTHQQIGLYAGVLVEPQGSEWYLPDGKPMDTREDGGPTSWQAIIVTADARTSHREYAIEFQDMHLAYTAESIPEVSNKLFMPKTAKNPDGIDNAPSAFYVGQASRSERLLAPPFPKNLDDFVRNGLNAEKLPQQFPRLFSNYGIQLSPSATVTVLKQATLGQGYLDGEWRIDQPPLASGAVNGGDFYIVKATNGVTNPAAGLPGQPDRIADCLSVFTPSIPPGFADPEHAVNPNPGSSLNLTDGTPLLYAGDIGAPGGSGPNFGNGAPYASLVSTRANGTYSMNYRNEPVQLRVKSGNSEQTDLAFAFKSIGRGDPQLNVQPTPKTSISAGSPYVFPPYLITPDGALDGAGLPQGTDPFTPLIRGYVGDDIQIRTLVGAHLQPHAFSIHGVHWLAQPSYLNSGHRNVQSMGISEHYEMRFKMPSAVAPREGTKIPGGADYFYSASTGAVGLSNGLWGIIRSYDSVVGDETKAGERIGEYLKPLPTNPVNAVPKPISFEGEFNKAKKAGAPVKEFRVHATTVAQAKNKALVYNSRADAFKDKNAVIFVQEDDLSILEQKDARFEPLILRAAAGDWIKLTLINDFPTDSTAPPFVKPFSFRYGNPFNDFSSLNGGKIPPTVEQVPMPFSHQVGLHPQLVAFDVTKANGVNVGFNPDSTKGPGGEIDYYWYAGTLAQKDGETIPTPVEFGATNLVGADLILQTQFGLVGALIIEPPGTSWSEDRNSRAFATVSKHNGTLLFRECVLVMQNMVSNLSPGRENAASQIGGRDAGFGAVNYRTENFASRNIATVGNVSPDVGFADAFSNNVLKPPADPETPVFVAAPGMPVRFRVVMPSTTSANGAAQPLVFVIHGHGWQDEPYVDWSKSIGHNDMAQFIGSQEVTVTQKYDIVIDSAGGPFQVPGDYLYQAYNQEQKIGIWGLFRVKKPR